VRTTYLVGSVALALILFDGGLRTRFQSIRAVLVAFDGAGDHRRVLTALITAPIARYALDLNWIEHCWLAPWWPRPMRRRCSCWWHAQGLRLRPRVGATLEVESAPTIRSRSFSR